MQHPIKVLIVDDSLLMRKVLTDALNQDENITVVGTAMDGDFALSKIERLRPDVIALDLYMPRMDGLQTLKIIQERFQIPTIIFSGIGVDQSYIALQALRYGAVDFVSKARHGDEQCDSDHWRHMIVQKIKKAYRSGLSKIRLLPVDKEIALINGPDNWLSDLQTNQLQFVGTNQENLVSSLPTNEIDSNLLSKSDLPSPESYPCDLPDIFGIGASTGGTIALEKIIQQLPENFPAAVVVVQHIPEKFSPIFVDSIRHCSRIPVVMASNNQIVIPGTIYIGPGDAHLRIKRVESAYITSLDAEGPLIQGHRPSVNALFISLAYAAGTKALGIILTGMGKDGAMGLQAIKRAGGRTAAQDQESCVVFGMPKEAIKINAVEHVLPLKDIASWMLTQVSKNGRIRK